MTNKNRSSLQTYGQAPFLIFCDHASNLIPAELNCLGLPEDLLETHIAWDIGAGDMTTALGKRLQGTVFKCGFSRLVIDVNRALTAGDIIPATSDQIPVPGNQMLNDTDRQYRIDVYHRPYHEQLSQAVDEMMSSEEAPFVVSIHSFTRRLMGAPEDRPWRVGMLWREDEASAKAMIAHLQTETGWEIGDNEPYDAREFNYSVDRHIGPRHIRHLTLEIRQDILCDKEQAENLADIIADGIAKIARHKG